jgi:hypothetical protein
LAILPEGHPLANEPRFPLKGLEGEPFMLLEKGGKAEISEIFERHHLKPDIKFNLGRLRHHGDGGKRAGASASCRSSS